jgi:hypothetical protein
MKRLLPILALIALAVTVRAGFHLGSRPYSSLGENGFSDDGGFSTVTPAEAVVPPASGWTDTNSPTAVYYFQTTNGFLTLSDASGNGHDGTNMPSGATGVAITNLGTRAGGGDELAGVGDGLNDFIQIPDSADFDFPGDVTFSVWVIRNEVNPGTIVGHFNTGSPFNGWELAIEASGADLINLWDGNNWISVAGNTITDSNWHHIAVVSTNGGRTAFYTDGIFKGSTDGGARNMTSENDVFIFRDSNSSPTRYLKGVIDDLRIYKGKTLSSNEVYTIWTNTFHALGSIEDRLTP